MIERGDATAEDIDTAMELGAGYRKSTSITRIGLTSSYGRKHQPDCERMFQLITSHSNFLISLD